MTGAVNRVAQLQPHRFGFYSLMLIKRWIGFVAHEVSDIVPEAITGVKDGTRTARDAIVDADGNVLAEEVAKGKWTSGKEEGYEYAADTVMA